jgi:hypothetical protein
MFMSRRRLACYAALVAALGAAEFLAIADLTEVRRPPYSVFAEVDPAPAPTAQAVQAVPPVAPQAAGKPPRVDVQAILHPSHGLARWPVPHGSGPTGPAGAGVFASAATAGWQGRARTWMSQDLGMGDGKIGKVLEAASTWPEGPMLVAIMGVESRGDECATGGRGKRYLGLCQVGRVHVSGSGRDREIAKACGAHGAASLYDPAVNLCMSRHIYADMLENEGGDVAAALARYGGAKGKAKGGAYVSKVMKNYHMLVADNAGRRSGAKD